MNNVFTFLLVLYGSIAFSQNSSDQCLEIDGVIKMGLNFDLDSSSTDGTLRYDAQNFWGKLNGDWQPLFNPPTKQVWTEYFDQVFGYGLRWNGFEISEGDDNCCHTLFSPTKLSLASNFGVDIIPVSKATAEFRNDFATFSTNVLFKNSISDFDGNIRLVRGHNIQWQYDGGEFYLPSSQIIENSSALAVVADQNLDLVSNFNNSIFLKSGSIGYFVNDGWAGAIEASKNWGIRTLDPVANLHIKIDDGDGLNDFGGLLLENDSLGNDYWRIDVGTNNIIFHYDEDGAANGINFVSKAQISSSTGAWLDTSDKRLKKNIRNLEDGVLEKLISLSPKSYNFKTAKSNKRSIGLIAQDLQKVFPEFVEAEEEYMAIDYAGLSTVAIKAIQEQQEIIEFLLKEVRELKLKVKENESE